eukprot:7220698-Alexandrium_andersonii.AAC.1
MPRPAPLAIRPPQSHARPLGPPPSRSEAAQARQARAGPRQQRPAARTLREPLRVSGLSVEN